MLKDVAQIASQSTPDWWTLGVTLITGFLSAGATVFAVTWSNKQTLEYTHRQAKHDFYADCLAIVKGLVGYDKPTLRKFNNGRYGLLSDIPVKTIESVEAKSQNQLKSIVLDPVLYAEIFELNERIGDFNTCLAWHIETLLTQLDANESCIAKYELGENATKCSTIFGEVKSNLIPFITEVLSCDLIDYTDSVAVLDEFRLYVAKRFIHVESDRLLEHPDAILLDVFGAGLFTGIGHCVKHFENILSLLQGIHADYTDLCVAKESLQNKLIKCAQDSLMTRFLR